ncbi:MAG: type II secretion system protein [Verrucomicrobiae bacterium]|nr:type II secretion system protein [Verrucomicrobiae bacterium]
MREEMGSMRKKRFGYTLAELLVVIILIGVLAGSLMVLAGNRHDREEAARVVSNLRILRTSALNYYMEKIASFRDSIALPGNGDANGNYLSLLEPYLTQPLASAQKEKLWMVFGVAPSFASEPSGFYFKVIESGGTSDWYVYYVFPDNTDGVKKIIAQMAVQEKDIEGETKGTPYTKSDSSVRFFVLGDTRSASGEEEEDGGQCASASVPSFVNYVMERQYPVGAVVQWTDGKVYVRIQQGGSPAPGDSSHWIEWKNYPATNENMKRWDSETHYIPNSSKNEFTTVCYKDGLKDDFYIYISSSPSGSEVPPASSKWQMVTSYWTENNDYEKGDVVLHDKKFYELLANNHDGKAPGLSSDWREIFD